MPVPDGYKKYILDGLEGTPEVLAALLRDVDAAKWDARPDPDRFTLREMVAHLADWEAIFAGRVQRTVDEDNPFLPSIDEGQLALDHGYAKCDPAVSLASFREERRALLDLFRSLPDPAWDRLAHREFIGDVTVAQLAAIVLWHDAYHLRQTARFVQPQHDEVWLSPEDDAALDRAWDRVRRGAK